MLNASIIVHISDAYRDLRTSETGGCIQTNTIATCAAVYFDFSGVWLEASSCIFGGDTALNRKASASNSVLRQAKLRKSRARGNLDLGSDDVDTSDLLYKQDTNALGTKKNISKQIRLVPVIVCSTWMRGLISMK